jgi:hypothetical protein
MDQENINTTIGVDSSIMAKLHLFYRSSVIGRRDLGQDLALKIKELKDFKYSNEFKNRNVEILQAYFKVLGLKIVFNDNKTYIEINTDDTKQFDFKDKTYICTSEEFKEIKREQEIRRKMTEDECFVGSKEEYEEEVKRRVAEQKLSETHLVIKI